MRIPVSLSFESGAVMEPFGVGVHASTKAQVCGETVLVTGAGPIGLYSLLAARSMGASRLWSAELSALRRDLARKVGANSTLDPAQDEVVTRVLEETDGTGCAAAIEASGSPAAFQQGLRALRKGGRMVVAAMPTKPLEIADASCDLVKKEATISGVHGREMYETWAAMQHLISDLSVDPGIVITHRFPLEAYTDAFDLALKADSGKILLIP